MHNSTAPGADTDFHLPPVLRHYQGRRCYPRVELHRAALVTTARQETLRVQMRNLSAEGIQIRCDGQTASRIQSGEVATGCELLLRFDLEAYDARHILQGRGRVCYVDPREDGQVAIGLQFVQLSLKAKTVLARFIVECMCPRE